MYEITKVEKTGNKHGYFFIGFVGQTKELAENWVGEVNMTTQVFENRAEFQKLVDELKEKHLANKEYCFVSHSEVFRLDYKENKAAEATKAIAELEKQLEKLKYNI